MARKFQGIPQPTFVENEIRKILVPIIDVIERRLLKRSDEKMISREDLLSLGLVTQEQLDSLED